MLEAFKTEFYELTGMEFPPQNRGQWLAVFTRAGFDQTQARQALGELPVTRQPDGSLDAVDISTAAASGEYPTFIQTLMDGLRAAATADGGYFTEEYRGSGDWCVIMGYWDDPPEKLRRQTFRNRTNDIGTLIRTIKNAKGTKYKIHLDDLPAGTKSLPLRNDIIARTKAKN
jgi:hypothetical protein